MADEDESDFFPSQYGPCRKKAKIFSGQMKITLQEHFLSKSYE
jgi:hypothetical protein